MLRPIQVTFKNGKSFQTSINGTDQDIRDYYLNNVFNLTTPSEEENGQEQALTRGIEVIFLDRTGEKIRITKGDCSIPVRFWRYLTINKEELEAYKKKGWIIPEWEV